MVPCSASGLKQAFDIMAKVQLDEALDERVLNYQLVSVQALPGPIPANCAPPKGMPFELPADAKY